MCGLNAILLSAVLIGSASAVRAQPESRPDSTRPGQYAIVLYATGGISLFPSVAGTPDHLETHVAYWGPSGTVRLMWFPDHRLRVGLESGWTTVYSYTIDGPGPTGRVALTAVPLLLMWSMPLTDRFSVFVGLGTYRLTSTLEYLGTTEASTFSLGYAAALSYVWPLNGKIGLDTELKWYYAAETRHTVLAAQVGVVWKLYRW